MADTTTGRIPKPQLRRILASNLRRHAIVAVVVTMVTVLSFKHFVADKRKKNYADFYVNYDENKVFEDMRKKGVFQSFPADK